MKSEFLDMLSESDAITERTKWKKVKGLYERDVQCKAVGGVAQREEWFQEHVKSLVSKVRGLREDGHSHTQHTHATHTRNTHIHTHPHLIIVIGPRPGAPGADPGKPEGA